jgi:hypothetical protein
MGALTIGAMLLSGLKDRILGQTGLLRHLEVLQRFR